MTIPNTFDNRSCERFALEPMYTSVAVRSTDGTGEPAHGHAYDLSETGVRIEIDDPPVVGTEVSIELGFPAQLQPIAVTGCVVWVHDAEDDPGARRLGLRFDRFDTPAHRARLHRALAAR